MPMTWTSLVAPKGTAGSIANWVGYGKIDIETVLDEAQSLIYSILRVREMRSEWVFGVQPGQSYVPLPDRFLDPIGNLYDVTNVMNVTQRIDSEIQRARAYDNTIAGTFGTDPFTTVTGSSTVTVALTDHGLTQSSVLTIPTSPAVGGLTMDGTFNVLAIIDEDTFEIDMGDAVATSSATGGGAGVTYTASLLIATIPSRFAIWSEALQFDAAVESQTNYKLNYYRAKPLLSSTNQSNFLTARYPKLIRVATTAAAAEFMKDDGEYNKGLQALTALVGQIAQENDMFQNGMVFGTDTPTPGDYY